MKTLMMLSALAVAGLIGGCIVHDDGPHHHRVYGPAVVVEAGHVHSDSCGHYHHDGRWYHSHNHRHGPNCGHVLRGGMWIVVN